MLWLFFVYIYGYYFACEYSMIQHQKIHYNKYQCNDCGNKYAVKQSLARHQLKNTGEKPYQCDQCDKQFTRKSSLIILPYTWCTLTIWKSQLINQQQYLNI